MTREDIIRMAQEAGFPCDEDWVAYGLEGFERFAALVAAHTLANIDPSKFMTYHEGYEAGAAAEREACAKVCDETFYSVVAADAIRARGEK
jgi:hypothetical protein